VPLAAGGKIAYLAIGHFPVSDARLQAPLSRAGPDGSTMTATTASPTNIASKATALIRPEAATIDIEKRPEERYVAPAQPSLVGLSRNELGIALGEAGVAERQCRMRSQQIWHWLYVRGAKDFEEMTTLSKDLRTELARRFTLDRPPVVAEQISIDGTRKWLLRLPGEVDGRPHDVECVYIPEPGRGTLCISSQVGCTLNCSFCHTGTQRLVRNLTAGEIVGQVMMARDRLNDFIPTADNGKTANGDGPAKRLVSNVVMMGMGEPLYNFEAVRDALNVVSDGEGLSLSKRRITLSTSGVVPQIARAGEEIGAMLAISLHAVTDELRDELVPLNRKYPIRELLDACRNYPGLSNARRITFEYVMLKGVNDSLADARALVRLLKGIPAKINLIPFNPWPGTKYECSGWDQIEKFSTVVFDAGYASPVRTPRGRDILAACGQLKSETEKLSARERLALRAMAMTDEEA
jgi:23S rRNA (adenine2503-C2)-methyltransferase